MIVGVEEAEGEVEPGAEGFIIIIADRAEVSGDHSDQDTVERGDSGAGEITTTDRGHSYSVKQAS